jgi:hypothetical protein
MEPQAAFSDGDVGPDLGDQLPLAYRLVVAGDQRDQNVERSRPQLHLGARFGEKPFVRRQAEWSERYYICGPLRRLHRGATFRSRLIVSRTKRTLGRARNTIHCSKL